MKVNYNPVKRLMGSIEKYIDSSRTYGRDNEFAYLSNVLDTLGRSKLETADYIERHEICAHALTRIFTTDAASNTPASILGFYGVNARFSSYIVLVVRAQDIDFSSTSQAQAPNGMTNEAYYEYAKLTLSNLISRMLPQSDVADVYSLRINDMRICVVNAKNDDIDILEHVNGIMQRLREVADSQYYISIDGAVSGVYSGENALREAYDEAVGRLCYITDTETVKDIYFPNEIRRQLIEAVNSHDKDCVKKLLRMLFVQNCIPLWQSYEHGSYYVYISDIIGLALYIMRQSDTDAPDNMHTVAMRVKTIYTTDNPAVVINEAEDIYCTIIDLLALRSDTRMRSQYKRMSSDACAYINKNYTDQNLSVSQIAEALGINAAALSKSFRDNMLESIPDYINRVRVERAKELIEAGQYQNLISLAQQIGYTNTKTLMRAFKRFTGVTPGQYKKLKGDENAAADFSDDDA